MGNIMRNTLALAGLTLSLAVSPQLASAVQRNAHHETLVLASKIDHLRAVVRPRSRLAEEAVCRMEEVADRLCAKLNCPHELEPILCAMRELTSAADSAALTIQRECRLRNDFVIRDSLERVLRQLARVQVAVEELARRATTRPDHVHHYGSIPHATVPGLPSINFGSSLPALPPWMRAELERRSAFSPRYEPHASGLRYEAYSRSPGQPGRPRDQFPPQAGTIPRAGGALPGNIPPGFSGPPVPGFSDNGRPNGRIGQTILSLLLSEALR